MRKRIGLLLWRPDKTRPASHPEAVDLVVLLAIPPNEAGTTHMQLLTALTTRLADDEIRARIQSATTPDELLSALDDKGGTQPSASFSNAPTIVCVTACPRVKPGWNMHCR